MLSNSQRNTRMSPNKVIAIVLLAVISVASCNASHRAPDDPVVHSVESRTIRIAPGLAFADLTAVIGRSNGVGGVGPPPDDRIAFSYERIPVTSAHVDEDGGLILEVLSDEDSKRGTEDHESHVYLFVVVLDGVVCELSKWSFVD